MCITSEPAVLKGTILLAHSFRDSAGNVQNLLGYKNKAKSLIRGGNCMIFAIPAISGSKVEIIDMTDHHDLLDDYAKLFQERSRGDSFGVKGLLSLSDRSIEIVERGSYTVVIASQASDIPAALALVKPEKRPRVNQALFDGLDSLYGAWEAEGGKRFVIACWAGDIDPEPILLHYRPIPSFEGKHVLPGLDAHDGGVPVPGELVETDHTIIVGLDDDNNEAYPKDADWDLRKVPADLRAKLPRLVIGRKVNDDLPNGDWVIPKDVTNVTLRRHLQERVMPPGAKAPVRVPVGGHGELVAQVLEAAGTPVERVYPTPGLSKSDQMLLEAEKEIRAKSAPAVVSTTGTDPVTSVSVRDSANMGRDYSDLHVVYDNGTTSFMMAPKVHAMTMVTRLMGQTRLVADMSATGTVYTRP